MSTMQTLIKRGGTKALQQLLQELGRGHSRKHGYAWNYDGATVRREGKLYFIDYDGQTRYLGTFQVAVEHLSQYAVTGTPNTAMCRAGSSSGHERLVALPIDQLKPVTLIVPVAAAPAPTITLEKYDIDMIMRYRTASEAFERAREKADANTGEAYLLWSNEDMAAVNKAREMLQECEMGMAMLFDYLAKQAGVR